MDSSSIMVSETADSIFQSRIGQKMVLAGRCDPRFSIAFGSKAETLTAVPINCSRDSGRYRFERPYTENLKVIEW